MLDDRVETLAGEDVVALDALLGEPDADRVARIDLEPAAPGERVDDLAHRRIGQRFPHARLDDRHDRQLDLARRDASPIARLDLAALARRAGRVRFEHFADRQPADGLLGAAQDLPGLGMAELPSLAIERKLDVRDETVTGAQRERDRTALDLDHLAVDLWKQRQDLIDDDAY